MKKQIRIEYISKRKQFTTTEVNAWSQAIAQNFIHGDFMDHQTFHVFLSMPKYNEINTQFIIDQLWRRDKNVIVPKMQGKQLLNCPFSADTELVKNNWGIMEPADCAEVPHDQIDVVLVPLLISDVHGNRIGYGGGYYDRFLAKLPTKTKFVGINFFEPVTDSIPKEDFDMPLDYLITPNGVHKFEH